MKFVWVPSTRRFRRTETEVRKEKLAYEVVEFETDKDSLIDRFNSYEQRIEDLEAQLAQIGGSAPAEAPEEEPSDGEAELPAEPAVQSPPVRPANDAEPEPTGFSPKLLEEQVEAFGMAGEEAFEQFDSYQQIYGVGAGFSRGVHMLTIIASGEHQLARTLFRSRKSRKWG